MHGEPELVLGYGLPVAAAVAPEVALGVDQVAVGALKILTEAPGDLDVGADREQLVLNAKSAGAIQLGQLVQGISGHGVARVC
jgi:hypothetical protein